MDTATLKEYVQLASDMGWPYQLVDWQWYGPYDKPTAVITNLNPAVDMEELRRFAKPFLPDSLFDAIESMLHACPRTCVRGEAPCPVLAAAS